MFVLTGVLESMERDDAKSLIERYGGKVTGNISRKTTYLVWDETVEPQRLRRS